MANVSRCDSVWLCYCSKKSRRKANDKEVQDFMELMICFLNFLSFLKVLIQNFQINRLLFVFNYLFLTEVPKRYRQMKSSQFGSYLKARRIAMGIPQRIVAHALNIDTSTLSKIEIGERQINISMIKPLAAILKIDYKNLQIRFISEKIMTDFSGQPFLKEALTEINKKLSI